MKQTQKKIFKHVYMKDVKEIVKSSFVNKNGDRVTMHTIGNELAVDHLTAPYGTYTMYLATATVEYLKKQSDFIKVDALKKKMRDNGFNRSEVDDALEWVKTRVDTLLKGQYSTEEIRYIERCNYQTQETHDWYDGLPETVCIEDF